MASSITFTSAERSSRLTRRDDADDRAASAGLSCLDRLESRGRSNMRCGPGGRSRPAYGVANDAADRRVVVGWVALVTGPEVEDLAGAARVACAGAEDLAARQTS